MDDTYDGTNDRYREGMSEDKLDGLLDGWSDGIDEGKLDWFSVGTLDGTSDGKDDGELDGMYDSDGTSIWTLYKIVFPLWSVDCGTLDGTVEDTADGTS